MIPPKPYFRKLLILIAGIILIQVLKRYPTVVEAFYTRGLFPILSVSMRALTSFFPFSIGDLLYISAIGWIILQLKNGFAGYTDTRSFVAGILWKVAWIYLIFNFLWGMNYNRVGMEEQLGIKAAVPQKKELESMVDILIEKMNANASASYKGKDFDRLKKISTGSYISLTHTDHQYNFKFHSIKPSIFGKLGNYLGYSGYYNPFSSEGQVNMHVPSFLLPGVACHEMAHQLGYAREDEANFIGFLAARNGDSSARYSVYFSSFLYANRALFELDSSLAKLKIKKLSPNVRRDLKDYKKYILQYHTPIESLVDYFYDHYLKFNEQPLGTVTYSRVVVWMAAYLRKHGDL
ncbi:MAG: DUF3810 domain-containing protein [Chitinophagaceae bacterium]